MPRGNRVLPIAAVAQSGDQSVLAISPWAASSGVMGTGPTLAGLRAMTPPYLALLWNLFFVTVLAPGIACAFIIAIPAARETTPGFSWANQGFCLGWWTVMLCGSACVGIAIPYMYGDPSTQRWPYVHFGIISIYVGVAQVAFMILPQATGAFPLQFIVPPVCACFWAI
jgi:hypothetical protein